MTALIDRKEIIFDRETADYALYLDGELVGFARTHHEGEAVLDQLVHDQSQPPTPAQQMSALLDEYLQAKADGRTDDAKRFKMQAVALEVEHPGTTDLVKAERTKAA